MAIHDIPVCLGGDYRKLIGKGSIEDGVLTITVKIESVVQEIEHLARYGDIRMLSLGLEYMASKPAVTHAQQLILDLRETLFELNRGIARVMIEHSEDPFRAQYMDGRYILLDALTKKAAVMVAIHQLGGL